MTAARLIVLCLFLTAGGTCADELLPKVDVIQKAIGNRQIVLAYRLTAEALTTIIMDLKRPIGRNYTESDVPLIESVSAVRKALKAGDRLSAVHELSVLQANLLKTGRALEARDRFRQFEEDSARMTGVQRDSYLHQVAYAALAAGELTKATFYAKEMFAARPSSWNDGNMTFHGNEVLGLVALRSGQIEEAKARLAAAGKTKGSPQLKTFGPSFRLARGLLEKGERDAVLAFLADCSIFWTYDQGKLAEWTTMIAAGRVPAFPRY